MLKRSQVGAVIDVDLLPLSQAVKDSVSELEALSYALSGGEDYELLFTVPEAQKGALETALAHACVEFTQVGQVTSDKQLRLIRNGEPFNLTNIGFEHFS